MKLKPFNFKGVELVDSRLKRQFDIVVQEYLSISDDDLLKGFRLRAGFDAPGKDLGGWYTRDAFLVFGQIISGLARMGAAAGNKKCIDKANHLVSEWAKCIAPDGYFFYSNNCNAPHYVYDKIAGGLLDAYLYCGNAQALHYLSRITDWAINNLYYEQRYAWSGDGSTEWYTLSENIYRAYLITGEGKYKDFAKKWEYTEFWDIFANKANIFDRWHDYHAYSHINSLGGAATAFYIHGESKYLNTLINAYDYFFNTQTYATGGFGPVERFKATAKDIFDSLFIDDWHFETQCGSWAIFKLVKHLISITGDARFGDWAELMIYNGIGASVPMGLPGEVQYWSNYNLFGAAKKNVHQWSCCTGTRPMAVADYYDLIWFHDERNIFVNLFVPSEVTAQVGENDVTISQTGEIGVDEQIEFRIKAEKSVKFGLNFRRPAWLAGHMQTTLNGREIPLNRNNSSWALIDQYWNNGDVLALKLPLNLRIKPLCNLIDSPSAIMYGPIVLTGQIEGLQSASNFKPETLCNELERSDSENLVFKAKSDKLITLRPFYSFKVDSEYFMYIHPEMARYRKLKLAGWWFSENNLRYANDPEATAEFVFEGTGIRWNGMKKNNGGKAQISIDGKVVDVVDQYHRNDGLPFRWTHTGLNPGRHTLHLKVLAQKHADSGNCFINIADFRSL